MHSQTKPVPVSPFIVEIDLDRQIYNPGQIINGQAKLILNKELACNFLTVRLYGSARVFFTEELKTPGKLGLRKAYEQERVLVDQAIDLWVAYDSAKGQPAKRNLSLEEIARLANPNAIRLPLTSASGTKKEEGHCLKAGVHEFQFQFKLPDESSLFTSFDARNSAGYVRYYIQIQASNEGYVTLKRKMLFPVVCLRDLSLPGPLFKLANEAVVVRDSKLIGKGQVTVTLELKKRGYVPGEPIQGVITIDNRSSSSVKYSLLNIIQRTICYSTRPEIKVNESFFETPGMGLPKAKVLANERFSYPIHFYVPALLPNMDIPECIEASYCLCLEIGCKRSGLKSPFMKLKTPLVIGTHPTSGRAELTNGSLPAAPPLYEDIHQNDYTDAPPSYALSIGGVSHMNGKGEDALKGEKYSPACYHYNFAFLKDEQLTIDDEKKTN